MSGPREIPPGRHRPADRSIGSRPFRLCRGQCRLRQDPRAGAAGDPAAAVRRRSRAHPLHHLHQGSRRQHGEPGVRRVAQMDPARRRRPRRGDAGRRRRSALRCAPATRATVVCARARDAGRPQGADHPRLLHAASASVSVRGQCGGALRGARRAHRSATAGGAEPRRDAASRRATGQPARPGARRRGSRCRRRYVPGAGARDDPQARCADALDRSGGRRAAGHDRAFAGTRHPARRDDA